MSTLSQQVSIDLCRLYPPHELSAQNKEDTMVPYNIDAAEVGEALIHNRCDTCLGINSAPVVLPVHGMRQLVKRMSFHACLNVHTLLDSSDIKA